jgi:hypothetical protein
MACYYCKGVHAPGGRKQKVVSRSPGILFEIAGGLDTGFTYCKLDVKVGSQAANEFFIRIARSLTKAMVKVGRDNAVPDLFTFLKVIQGQQQTYRIRSP